MPTTTHWVWTVEFDQPTTGDRVAVQGETIAPFGDPEQEVRRRLFSELTTEIQRRYGAGYRIEGLSPSCRFVQK